MKIRSALLVALLTSSFFAASATQAHADSSILIALFTTPFKSDTGNGVIKEPPANFGEDPYWDEFIRDLVDRQKKTGHSNPRIAALMAQYMKLKEAEKRMADEAIAACRKAFLTPAKCADVVVRVAQPRGPR
jgi:hypothetical protein